MKIENEEQLHDLLLSNYKYKSIIHISEEDCVDEYEALCVELAEGNYCDNYEDICRNSCHPDCIRELRFK